MALDDRDSVLGFCTSEPQIVHQGERGGMQAVWMKWDEGGE